MIKKNTPTYFLIAIATTVCFWTAPLFGQGPLTGTKGTDWLIDPSPYHAEAHVSEDGQRLELTNGLVRRSFVLAPNLATIALDNLTTQQSVLRAVGPEARLVIDGTTYDVGGLKGQPNHAFLTDKWLDNLQNDPQALQYVAYSIEKPQERISWKKVRYHADIAWPPPGVMVKFRFRFPDSIRPNELKSEHGRILRFKEDFQDLAEAWTVSKSSRHERISFQNEGKAGEIYALSNTFCYATRKLEPDTQLVEATIDPGTDGDSSWGPGMAVVLADRVVEVSLRPGDRGEHGNFELRDQGKSQLGSLPQFASEDGGLDTSHPYRLRARIDEKKLIWEVADASQADPKYVPLFAVDSVSPSISEVRIGKTDRDGGGSDGPQSLEDEKWYRSRIIDVCGYGPIEKELLKDSAQSALSDVAVNVCYEMYDGIPGYGKWIEIVNGSAHSIHLDKFSSDLLAAVEFASEVDTLSSAGKTPPNLHVETDMAFGGMMASGANRHSYRWLPDPEFHTQVNYEKQTPCLLEVGPDIGPDVDIPAGQSFATFRSWVLTHDSTERERKGLTIRRFYRTIAPWVTENPLMMHLIASDEASVHRAIDQCAEVGFEMLIMSFGSGFNVEDRRPENLTKAKAFADYAKSKGIEIGSYSLLASRRISDEHDVVMPEGMKPIFGNSPCLGSRWGESYFEQLDRFYRQSGFTLLEHDGSYPGDVCASEFHPGHRHLADSKWRQWEKISNFYQWCRGEGIFLNVPDHYFLAGSNKTGMGYREVNWSLPRAEQVIHTRQNIYDGTWEKLPSMGWMFVPLTQYHGGGAAATIEPLSEHLDHYARMLDSNLALGVQACYRGPRLYDTEATKNMVMSKVAWYKKYRTILEGDLIHGRRADARDIDWMLHVDPASQRCGMLVVFNPKTEPVQRSLRVPLYYTGLTQSAIVTDHAGSKSDLRLERDYSVQLDIDVPAEGMSWYLFERQ